MPKVTHEQIFVRLVENALDFFDHSTRELDADPKYSMIHFCAAVELFVKARLMKEHWSLIVSKPEGANWAQFCIGDFVSVGLRDANKRLHAIAADGLTKDELEAFERLVVH